MPVQVNGEMIDDATIREEMNSLRPRYEAMMPDMDPMEARLQLWEWSKENVIERVLLKQEALRDPEPLPADQVEAALEKMRSAGGPAGCLTTENDAEIRKDVETRLRVDRLMERVFQQVPPPKAKDVSEFYKKNKEQFRMPELVHAAHIVKNVDENTTEETARAAIEEVQRALQAGRPFAEVADESSDCRGNGGDLGYFPRGEMVEEFDAVVFAMKPGEVSGIFRTSFGFHIATVLDRRPAGYRSFPEVKEQIEQELRRERQVKAIEDLADSLRAKAEIRQVSRAEAKR